MDIGERRNCRKHKRSAQTPELTDQIPAKETVGSGKRTDTHNRTPFCFRSSHSLSAVAFHSWA